VNWKSYAFVGRVAVAVLLGFILSAWLNFLPTALSGKVDFRHLYTAGYLLRTGQRHLLYDQSANLNAQQKLVSSWHGYPYNHLAYEAILFAPFSLIPYRAAYLCFALVNVLVMAACAWILRSIFPWAAIPTIWAGFLMLFLPLYFVLTDGQDSLLLLLCFVVSLWMLNKGWDESAGMAAGLGLFKFQFVLPVGLLFLCWRRWRFCLGVIISTLAVVGLSIWLTGWAETVNYVGYLLGMGTSSQGRATYGIVPGDMPNIRGLVFGLTGEHPVIVLALSLGVLTATWAKMKNASRQAQFIAATVAGTVVSYHCLSYDWTVLLPAAVVAIVAGGFSRLLVTGAFVASSFLFMFKFFPLGTLPLTIFLFFNRHDAFQNRDPHTAQQNGNSDGVPHVAPLTRDQFKGPHPTESP
jgi:hypothetical protein